MRKAVSANSRENYCNPCIGLCLFFLYWHFWSSSEPTQNVFVFCAVIQVQAVLKRKEEEDQQTQQLIQALQASLEKEKAKVRDLKKQVMAHLLFYLLKR